MRLRLQPALILALALCLGGCHASPQVQMRYRFLDGGQYRVDDAYQIEKQTVKTHDGKPFATDSQMDFAQASYRVKIRVAPDQSLTVEYSLLRLRIHDSEGQFKLEAGPENGWLSWYNQEQPLTGYLDPREFARYQQEMRKPIAVVRVDARGVEQKEGTRFNNELLALLGKNRVIGKRILRTFKIPPLVTVVFPEATVHPGESWDYQGNHGEADDAKPLVTRYRLQAVKNQEAVVLLNNRVDFTGEELKALGSQLGLPETERMTFKESFLSIQGTVRFLTVPQRPASGVLKVEKHYGLQVDQENWDLSEKEEHQYTVTPDL